MNQLVNFDHFIKYVTDASPLTTVSVTALYC